MKKSLSILSAALLVALVLSGPLAHPALATDPCASAPGDPSPPGGGPEPTIAGTVTNASTSAAIANASMYLYVCLGETSVAVTPNDNKKPASHCLTRNHTVARLLPHE